MDSVSYTKGGIILHVVQAVFTLDSVVLHNMWAYIACGTGSVYTRQCFRTQHMWFYFMWYMQCVHWTVLPFTTAQIIFLVVQSVSTLDSVAFHNSWDCI